MATEINVPIKLQIANLQDIVKSMRGELSTLHVDSTSYKKLSGVITDIERRIASLQVKAQHPFINVKQFADAEKEVNAIGDDLYKLQIEAGKIKFGDLSLSAAQSNQLKAFDASLAEIDKKLKTIQSDAKTAFLQSDIGKTWANGKSDSELKSMEKITEKIQEEVRTRQEAYDQAVQAQKDYNTRMEASRKLTNWMKGGHQLSAETMGKTYAEAFKANGDFKAGGRTLLADWLTNEFSLPRDVVESLVKNSGKAVLEAFNQLKSDTDAQLKAEAARVKASAADERTSTNRGRTYAENVTKTKAELETSQRVEAQVVATNLSVVKSEETLRQAQQETINARREAERSMLSSARTAIAEGDAARQAAGGVHALQDSLREGSETIQKFDAGISKLSGVSNFINRYIGIYAVMRRVVSAIRDAFNNIKELDKNITNIAVVTNMSQQDLWGKIGEYTAMAQQYGVATKDVYTVSQIFYQQGLQTSQVLELTTETLKMAKIAGIDYSDAANAMTVAVRAFKIEMSEAQQVTDTYSALAAKFAVSSAEIANAMEKTASSAASVGMSLQSTSAFMSVMIQTTRESAQNIGSAMKSIISRYGEMKASPASLLNVDGEEVAFNKVDTALQSIGISIKDASGQFRDFDDVIMELAAKWDTLDNNTQRYIATIMAGNRQQSRFIALVSNYDELSRAMSTAENAENASIVQVAKTMDSLETKAQQVQNAFSQLYLDLHIEEGLKNIYTWLTNILKTIGKLGTGGALATLANILGFGGGVKGAVKSATDWLSKRKEIKVDNSQAKQTIEETRQLAEKPMTTQWKVDVDTSQIDAATSKLEAMQAAQMKSLSAQMVAADKSGIMTQQNAQAILLDAQKSGLLSTQGGAAKFAQTNNLDPSSTEALLAFGQVGSQLGIFGAALQKATGQTENASDSQQNLNTEIANVTAELVNKQAELDKKSKTGSLAAADIADRKALSLEIKQLQEKQKTLEEQKKNLPPSSQQPQTQPGKPQQQEKPKATREESKKEKGGAFSWEGKDTLRKWTSLLASAGQIIGTAVTAIGAAHQDKSTDQIETSKVLTGLGNGVSMAGTGASMGMLFGPWGAAIGAIGGFLLGAFNAIEDGLFISLQERLALQQEEAKRAQDESLKAQAKVTDVSSQLANLKKLQKAMYNSTEDMNAYTEAMNTLGEQYPALISTYDAMGNAVIDLADAEQVLLKLRQDSAASAREAAIKQADVAQTQLEVYNTGLTPLNNVLRQLDSKTADPLRTTGDEAIKEGFDALNEFVKTNATTLGVTAPDSEEEYGWARKYFGWELTNGLLKLDETYLQSAQQRLQGLVNSQEQILYNSGRKVAGADANLNFLDTLAATDMNVSVKNAIADSSIFNAIGSAYMNAAIPKNDNDLRKYNTAYEWSQKDNAGYEEAKTNISDALMKWLKNKTANDIEQINQKTSNLAAYKNADELLTALGLDGLKENNPLLSGIAEAFRQNNKANIEHISEAIYSNNGFGWELNDQLKGLKKFSSIDSNNNELNKGLDIAYIFRQGLGLVSEYSDYFTTELLKVNDLAAEGMTSLASARLDALYNIANQLKDMSGKDQDALFATITSIDWNSFDSITNAIKLIETYRQSITDETVISQLDALTGNLKDAADSLVFNVNTLASELTSGVTKAAKEIESLASANKSGMTLDSALEEFKKLSASAETKIKSFTDAFTFDESLGKYVYTEEGLLASLKQQRNQFETNQEQLKKSLESENRLFGSVNETGDVILNSGLDIWAEGREIDFENLDASIEKFNSGTQDDILIQSVLKDFKGDSQFEKSLEGFKLYLKQRINNDDIAAKAAQAALDELNHNEQYTLAHNIDWGQLVAGNGTAADTAMAQRLAESLNIKQETGEIVTEYYQRVLDAYLGTLDGKAKEQFERAQKNAHQIKLDSAYKDIISNWQSISEAQRVALENVVSPDDYDALAKYFKENGDGTYTLDWNSLLKNKDQLNTTVQDYINEEVAKIFDDATAAFEKNSDFFTKGTSNFADQETFKNEMQELARLGYLGEGWLTVNTFEFDEATSVYKLSASAWNAYVSARRQQLQDLGYDAQQIKSILVANASEKIDIASFVKAESNGENSQARAELERQIESLLIASGGHGMDAQSLAKEYANMIAAGGTSAISVLQSIASNTGKEVNAADIESAYRVQVNNLNSTLDKLMSLEVGNVVDANTAALLRETGAISVDENGIVTKIDNLVLAYEQLYQKMGDSMVATSTELNRAYAKMLNASEQSDTDAISVMQNAMGMTYDALGEMLGKYGISLQKWLDNNQNLYEKIGGGKIRLTDFTAFAQGMGWQPGSEEYTSAFKAYNDSLVELNQKTEKAIAEEAKGLSGAKAGDKINLTMLWTAIEDGISKQIQSLHPEEFQYQGQLQAEKERITSEYKKTLEAYGATFENGILEIGANANIQGIISTIANLAQQNADLLPNQLAELSDVIYDYIKNIANLIKNGISGGMSNVEAQSLQAWASSQKLGQLDFTQTTEGLKLSVYSATELYNKLKEIDSIQASLVFDELNNSLKETNENYRSVSDIIRRIAELNKLLADEKVSGNRKQQYQAELALANEIKMVRATTEDDSFNFMSGDIPAAQKNPLNYIKNWSEAFKTIKEAFKVKKQGVKGGYMDYEDWYNIVNEMNNIAALGQDIEIAGVKLDGSLEAASKLIQKGADSLTMVDTGEVKVNLGKFGVGLKSSADLMGKDVESGIQSMANAQVEMLDGLIAMLELVVSMQELGDIDTEGNGIDLTDLFTITYDAEGNETGRNMEQFSKDYERWVNYVKDRINEESANYNKDLANAINGIKIEGTSLVEILDWTPGDFTNAANKNIAQAYTAILDAFTKAAQSGNYDLNNIQQSVLQVLSQSGLTDTVQLQIGEITYYISGSTVTMIDWQSEDTQAIIKKLNAARDKNQQLTQEQLSDWVTKYGNNTSMEPVELTAVLALKKKVELDDQGNVVSVVVNGKSYKQGDDNFNAALSAAVLEDQGFDVSNWTVSDTDEATAVVTTKIGKREVRVESKDGKVSYVGSDGRAYPTQDLMLQEEYGHFLDTERGARQKYANQQEFNWGEYGIPVNIDPKFTLKQNGKDVEISPAKDPILREDLNNLLRSGHDNIQKYFEENAKDNKDGTYTVALPSGSQFTFTGGENAGQEFEQYLGEQLGIDTALSNTITNAITTSVPLVVSSLGELDAGPLTTIADALNTIVTSLTNLASVDYATISAGLASLTEDGTGKTGETVIKINTDIEQAKAAIGQITGQIDELSNRAPKIVVQVTDLASAVIDAIQRKINSLTGKEISIAARDNSKGGSPSERATGNVGLAQSKGTLMGELGPELVVSNGRYFVAGQNGAEFVDLDSDAIVFNHLQTEQLLKKGTSSTRGRAITNERTAVAYARGNIHGGPAMASAEAALAALKELRSMWAKLAGMTVKDLAGLGGSGGGGGGNKAFLKELERWYNYLQQIAELEEKINREELKRQTIMSDMIPHGQDFAASQLESLAHLQDEIRLQQQLVDEQQKYFDDRRKQLNEKSPFASLYQFDENGQLIYQNGAFEQFTQMVGTDKHGKPNMSVEDQYKYITETLGIDASYLQYDSSGKKIEETDTAGMVQAFWDRIEADQDEMQSLHDSINEHQDAVLQAQQQQNEIMKAIEDNQIAVEDRVLNAMVDARQREIDELQKQRDAIQEASDSLIDGLSDQLQKERDMYDRQQKSDELTGLQRRLSILQRSGGSASEIASLQDQISGKQQDAYFDAQQAQIDALQEASDAQLERLDNQIELMTEQLAYEKENGLLWGQVATIMQGSPEQIANFIQQNDSQYWGESPTKLIQDTREILFEAQQFTQFRDSVEGGLSALVEHYTDTALTATDTTASDAELDPAHADSTAPEKTTETKTNYQKKDAEYHTKIQKTRTWANGAWGEWKTNKTSEKHTWNKNGKCTKCKCKKPAESGGPSGGASGDGTGGGSTVTDTTSGARTGGHWVPEVEGHKWAERDSAGKWYYGRVYPHIFNDQGKCKTCGYINRNDSSVATKGGLAVSDAPVDSAAANAKANLMQELGAYVSSNALHQEALSYAVAQAQAGEIERRIQMMENMPTFATFDGIAENNSNSTVFEHTEVNLNFDKLSNDYDAKRAGQVVMDEMLRIAAKSSGGNRVGRR